jgi:Fanconi anemia group M protein
VADFFSGSRIIATTASPGGDRERIDEITRHLRIGNLEIRDENSPDVVEYIKGIDVDQVRIPIPPACLVITARLGEMMDDLVRKLESFGFALSGRSRKELIALGDIISGQIREGNAGFFNAARYRTQAILIDYLREFAETQGTLPFGEYLARMKEENAKARPIFRDARMAVIEGEARKLIAQPMHVHTPKISKVMEILRERSSGKVIIFCHYRITANILSGALTSQGISSEKFIGQSSRGDGKGMSQKDQVSALQRFRDGDFRVLVATQVGEEGLDVPSADTVIFYEPVSSEIRSIQRRGRTGRFGKGKVYVLMMENSRDMAYYYSAGRKENRMKRILREDVQPGKKDPQTTFDGF